MVTHAWNLHTWEVEAGRSRSARMVSSYARHESCLRKPKSVINYVKGVEKLELSYIAGQNVKCSVATLENSLIFPRIVIVWPSNDLCSTFRHVPMRNEIQKPEYNVHSSITLFTINGAITQFHQPIDRLKAPSYNTTGLGKKALTYATVCTDDTAQRHELWQEQAVTANV